MATAYFLPAAITLVGILGFTAWMAYVIVRPSEPATGPVALADLDDGLIEQIIEGHYRQMLSGKDQRRLVAKMIRAANATAAL